MKNTIIDIEDCKKEMQVTVEWCEISGDYDDIVADYMQAGLPGFRPGKSPKALIEKRYKSKIEEDVQNRSAKRIFKEVIAETDMEFTGAAEVSDIIFVKGERLSFKAVFNVLPDFKLPDYKDYKSKGDNDALEDDLTDYLLDNTNLEVPGSMVDFELNFSDDESEEDARKAAEERVKLLLILKKIAKIEGIEIEDTDVDERIDAMADEYGITVSQLRTNLEQSNAMPRIKSFLLAEHTISYLLEK